MEVHASVLLSDAGLDVVGIAAGASSADVLVSVQGDGVIQYDAVKEVRARALTPACAHSRRCGLSGGARALRCGGPRRALAAAYECRV
jgi:hypothetical protein